MRSLKPDEVSITNRTRGRNAHRGEEKYLSINRSLRLFAAGGIALLVVGAAVACGGGSDNAVPTQGVQVKTPGSGATSPATSGGSEKASESVKISMKDNLFEPKTFTVPAGKSVEIEVKNNGAAIHNLHILSEAKDGKDFSSTAIVSPGAENKFTVKLTKTGTYTFQCDYHVPDMVGTITVQ